MSRSRMGKAQAGPNCSADFKFVFALARVLLVLLHGIIGEAQHTHNTARTQHTQRHNVTPIQKHWKTHT